METHGFLWIKRCDIKYYFTANTNSVVSILALLVLKLMLFNYTFTPGLWFQPFHHLPSPTRFQNLRDLSDRETWKIKQKSSSLKQKALLRLLFSKTNWKIICFHLRMPLTSEWWNEMFRWRGWRGCSQTIVGKLSCLMNLFKIDEIFA